MPLDKTILFAIAPELKAVDANVLDTLYKLTTFKVPELIWGEMTEHARALLVAHMQTIAGRSGRGGPIKSEKVGDLARTFGVQDTGKGDSLQGTSHGLEYLRLRKCVVKSPIFNAC